MNIVYGLPTDDAFEQEGRGETVLGGCCVTEDDPKRACTKCGYQWRIKKRRPTPKHPL